MTPTAPVNVIQVAAPFTKSQWQLHALPPLSLYIHIPWCLKKCPYCDFNSHELRGPNRTLPEAEYITALLTDLELALPLIWGRRVVSVFLGGGTPSLLSAAALDRLLAGVRALLPITPDAEITLEANPGTFEADKFRQYKEAGINRLSVGIQSFDAAKLHALGRVHNGDEARRAADIARHTFDNFNLDLMYALPGQSVEQALADIETALNFAPTHLSCYHLTLEPNTLFYRHPPALPDDDTSADMQEAIEARLATAGFVHYETSAFSLPERQARHNLNYWTFGDYLGIGAGAHSKLSFPDKILRQVRYKQPAAYLNAITARAPIQTEHAVSQADLPFEFMLNALRLTQGFPSTLFAERTGLPLIKLASALRRAEQQDLVRCTLENIAPSPRGQRFLNELLQLFMPE